MRILLDTQIALWALVEQEKLPDEARELLEDIDNELVFSVVNILEVAIKRAQERERFQVEPHVLRDTMLRSGYSELPVMGDHAVAVRSLPKLHKDPFDRLLIAQAMVEGIVLLTADAVVAKYPGPIRKV